MSIVVLVASESRTLVQTPDPNALIPLLAVDWRELVFGSTPLPANEQVGFKIHPGQVTSTSILFKHNMSSNSHENMHHSSSPSALPASPASAVIGISVLWQFPVYKHCHRILCFLQQLKLDVEQALRDESHYLLTHVVNAFVLRHEKNGSFSSHLSPSQLPPFSSCLQLLERELGLNFVAQVLADALISFYSSRRQKLLLHTNESPLVLKHLMYAIYYVIANVTMKDDSGTRIKTSYNEAVFVEEEMDEKSIWVADSNIEDLSNDAFASNYQSSNVTKVSPFLPESSFINEQQSRMASSEDESLGYFSSSSSQGSTTAIEVGVNNDDLVGNGTENEKQVNVHLNGELLGNASDAFTHTNRNAIRSATQSEPVNESVSVLPAECKSDEISSFQGFLREYRDLRFKSSPSSSPPSSPVPRDECTLILQSTHASKNSSTLCLVPVKECNGLLYTCYPAEERSNLFTSHGSLAISHTNSRELFGHISPCNLVVDVENLVNLIPNETCLLPHYLVQGMLMKKGDRMDDLLAALSKCTCEGCSYCDKSCIFKLIDLDTVSPCESTPFTSKNNGHKGGFILEMLRSIIHLKQLGLPEKILEEYLYSKLKHELPLKAALLRSCSSSFALTPGLLSQQHNCNGPMEPTIYSNSHSTFHSSLEASLSWIESSLSISSLLHSLSLSSKKFTCNVNAAISSKLNHSSKSSSSKSQQQPDPQTCEVPHKLSMAPTWVTLGICEGDFELFLSLPNFLLARKCSSSTASPLPMTVF